MDLDKATHGLSLDTDDTVFPFDFVAVALVFDGVSSSPVRSITFSSSSELDISIMSAASNAAISLEGPGMGFERFTGRTGVSSEKLYHG